MLRTAVAIIAVLLFHATASPASAAVITLSAVLTGAAEVPAPGDPDGSGTAALFVDDIALTVSWNIVANDIELPLTGAHIHSAPAGVAGPIVVNFSAMLVGGPIFDADLAAVLAAPHLYYVNVHNAAFPAGAIRGQLAAVPAVPEPGTLALLALGLAGSIAASRRKHWLVRETEPHAFTACRSRNSSRRGTIVVSV